MSTLVTKRKMQRGLPHLGIRITVGLYAREVIVMGNSYSVITDHNQTTLATPYISNTHTHITLMDSERKPSYIDRKLRLYLKIKSTERKEGD